MEIIRSIEASEAEARFQSILDDVERGHSISITRHGRLIARLSPEPDESSERARKAFETFDALRKLNAPVTAEETLAFRDEGRR